MSRDYFKELPPELILLLSPLFSTASLHALASTCSRLHEILQPELESRIAFELASTLLLWASESRPHIVAKLLSPPHSTHPSPGDGWSNKTALHVAAKAGNTEIAGMLLDAGANPATEWGQDEYQPLHLAAMNQDLEMMKLLLDYGAPVDARFGCEGCSETALHYAWSIAHVDMINLLLERGADFERRGHFGTALGFAVHRGSLEVVKLLLGKGADATVYAPLFVLLDGGPPPPHTAGLLYIAMDLRHPSRSGYWGAMMKQRQKTQPTKWEGLPLGEEKKELMALLLTHGASKDTTMALISRYLAPLAEEAQYTQEEYLALVSGMIKEAEDAIPDVLRKFK